MQQNKKIQAGPYTVGVVITTYNKPVIIRQCLQSVYNQTYPLSQVVVIDNSPNDQTEALIKKEFPCVVSRHFPENIGSAGGYHEGLKIAALSNDFIWIWDDDITGQPQTLAEMLAYIPVLESRGNFGAIRCNLTGHKGLYKETDSFAWRGTLLKQDVIKQTGLPLSELFLYGCDFEYSYRIKKKGFRIYLVVAGSLSESSLTPRNSFLFFGKATSFYQDPFRLYYSHRNMLYVFIRHKKFLMAIKHLIHSLIGILYFSFREKELRSAILSGIADGLASKLNKNKRYLKSLA